MGKWICSHSTTHLHVSGEALFFWGGGSVSGEYHFLCLSPSSPDVFGSGLLSSRICNLCTWLECSLGCLPGDNGGEHSKNKNMIYFVLWLYAVFLTQIYYNIMLWGLSGSALRSPNFEFLALCIDHVYSKAVGSYK